MGLSSQAGATRSAVEWGTAQSEPTRPDAFGECEQRTVTQAFSMRTRKVAPAAEGSWHRTPALHVSLGIHWVFVEAGRKKPFPAFYQKRGNVSEPVKTTTDLPKSW